MPTYHDLCVEMGKRGPYLTDPIGKCLRDVSAFRGDGKSRIDKYLKESATYEASLRKEDLQSRFRPSVAVEAVLAWTESRKDQTKVRFPVLADEESGVIKQAKKEYYGLLEDVEECLFRQSGDGSLIPWHETKQMDEEEFIPHTPELIAASDSSVSTIGTNPSSSSRRVGQGHWRNRVSKLWKGRCVVTGVQHPGLLRASHIKRWARASTDERLDEHNGLLLAAHIDAAFEVGLLSFSDDGKILISRDFPIEDQRALGIHDAAILTGLSERTRSYLAWHRIDHGFGTR
jgi:hypothetical protein